MVERTGGDHPGDPSHVSFRSLPSVDALVRDVAAPGVSAAIVRAHARRVLAAARRGVARGESVALDQLRTELEASVADLAAPRLTPVLNATGVIIHTNLGRAPVSADTAAAMAAAAAHAVPLEIDPHTNQRGGRLDEITRLLRELTGAEASLVVNNGAAALLLAIAALGAGREILVARGEAIEIGGGFRIPDIVRQGGARIVDVGTTNRTYVSDYLAAVTAETAAFLRVHQSNFTLTGFTSRPTTQALAKAARESRVPLIEDLGGGALLPTAPFGLPAEPTLGEALAAGADVVTASGDKLLGGPQAGIICGAASSIARLVRHPLARAVRADKTTLAGVAATLRHYLAGTALTTVPVWRMIAAGTEELQARATLISAALAAAAISHAVIPTACSVGGGAAPATALPGVAISFDGDVTAVARRLRTGAPAVFGRIEAGRLLLELRTVLPEEDAALTEAICRVCGPREPESNASARRTEPL